ncbi:hypothetical protein J3R30DRAFT_1335372 [Lentinula aciculospora]|uniref:DUF6533 domain-containing protein n=1 Tax=Lentinula aciculospora TaxID=153920 RepID=A0A9W9AL16_9AGAR|nr:hypothetical protein J3R30DRAFT_1335372 [Lentinula aciculospora]
MNNISTTVWDIDTIRCVNLAASIVILYDHLLTLDDEFRYIWKKSWSLGKALFIINRYYSLIATAGINNYALFDLTEAVSFRFFYWEGWGGLITCMIAEIILQMRLYALYSLNKKILTVMIISFILSLAGAAVVVGFVLNDGAVQLDSDTLFCVPTLPTYSYSFWIPRLAFETVLCILALIRGFQLRDEDTIDMDWSGSRLMKIMIKDSIGYYIIMFVIYLMCLVVWIKNINLALISFGFSVAFSCVLGNRLMLTIRKVAYKREGKI